MPWFSLRRDGVVLLVFGLLVVMLWAGLAAESRVFAFAMTGLIGVFAAVGLVRRGRRRTWVPPILASVVLAISFAGMFARQADVVTGPQDTVLGFHPATAFLIYGLWIPAFFTLGVGFALTFTDDVHDESGAGVRDGGAR